MSRSNRRGYTNGCADPLKKYTGHYRTPPKAPPRFEGSVTTTRVRPRRCPVTRALVFSDWTTFRPNMTPQQVMQSGSFGGTYFRPIFSSVTNHKYTNAAAEFPGTWWKGLTPSKHLSSATYDKTVNRYRVACGGSLDMWESSGWIHAIDPYGWFQWYCRFYRGRRCEDDARQIRRWCQCAGVSGRFRNQLIAKCYREGKPFDDESVSPVIRQTLQHWAYVLTDADAKQYAKKKGW